MLAVYIPPPAAAQPGPFDSSAAELAVWDQSALDDESVSAELHPLGITLSLVHDGGVFYFAVDPEFAERELRRLAGPNIPARWIGASTEGLRMCPFGSWLADGLTLHLFYALRLNGEQPGGCVIVERVDRVLVSLMIVDHQGATTLVGGFTPAHATVALRAEIGDVP